MKKQELPLSVIKGVMTKKLSRLAFTIVITITSIFYPYSTASAMTNASIVRAPKIETRRDIIGEYIEGLQKEGYSVVSYSLDKDKLPTRKLFSYYGMDRNEMDQVILDSLDVIVSCVQLSIENDDTTYYFKNEQDSQEFIDRLNAIETQTYNLTNTNQHYSTITSTTVLDEKIEQITTAKQEKEEQKRLEAERRRQQQAITSRSSTSTRGYHEHTFPLASYVYVSSNYGMRNGKMHTGIDFAAASGTEIYSWYAGTVTFAGWSGGYGNFIIVDHGDGFVTRYAHCSKIAVNVGDTVSQGQVIGYVGTTGNSTGNHLHFEIKVNGNFVNPRSYMSI